MKNYKTTICGIMAAIGTYLSTSQTGWLQILGQLMAGAGTLLLGYQAADKKA